MKSFRVLLVDDSKLFMESVERSLSCCFPTSIRRAGTKSSAVFMLIRQCLCPRFGREFEQYMRGRAQGVHVLSSFASVQHRDMKKMAADIQEYFAYVEERLC